MGNLMRPLRIFAGKRLSLLTSTRNLQKCLQDSHASEESSSSGHKREYLATKYGLYLSVDDQAETNAISIGLGETRAVENGDTAAPTS